MRHYEHMSDIRISSCKDWYVQESNAMGELTRSKGFAVHPTHRLLACAGDDRRVRLWSLDYSEPILALQGPDASQDEFPALVNSLLWCPDRLMSEDLARAPLTLAVACQNNVFLYTPAL